MLYSSPRLATLALLFAVAGIAFAQPVPTTRPAGAPAPAVAEATRTVPTTTPSPAPATPPPAAAQKPSDLKITLMDGSIIAGKLSVNDLAIDTKFGSLKVPVEQIQSFMPGLGSHPDFQTKINQYINDLGADTFSDREKAQAALQKIGPDLRIELERQSKLVQGETLNRLQVILDEFQAQSESDDAPRTGGWVKDDVIVTPGFTVVGHITTPGFAVNTNFGTLNLKMEDIRQGSRDVAPNEDLRKTVSVTGAAFATRQFTNSALKVSKGDKIEVTATGSLVMTPWGGNQQSTPDGASNFGSMQSSNGVLYGGTLIGRIGDGGPNFKLGSKATITADRAGVLQLGIATTGDYSSYSFPGEYQVKIRVVKKN